MIRDIKPLIPLQDSSLFIFIITILVGLVVAFWLGKKAYGYSRYSCKICCQKYFLVQLKKINWQDPKRAAYEATKYGMYLARDKRQKEIFNQLRVRLDRYKYKQDISKVDKETMRYYNLYVQVCDESI